MKGQQYHNRALKYSVQMVKDNTKITNEMATGILNDSTALFQLLKDRAEHTAIQNSMIYIVKYGLIFCTGGLGGEVSIDMFVFT